MTEVCVCDEFLFLFYILKNATNPKRFVPFYCTEIKISRCVNIYLFVN